VLLFRYKKLPDASRSIVRSLRIFKGELNELRDDDQPAAPEPPAIPPLRGEWPPAGVDTAEVARPTSTEWQFLRAAAHSEPQ
jgi:hypothetical protein